MNALPLRTKLPVLLALVGLWACPKTGSTPNTSEDMDSGAGGNHGDGDRSGDGDGSGNPNNGDGDHSGSKNDGSVGDGDGDSTGDGDVSGNHGDASVPDAGHPASEFDARAIELCKLVNEYRMQNGLAAVPVSKALMTVAQLHVDDLAAHGDEVCSMHAWSGAMPDKWRGCCYDPANPSEDPQCMWEKPGEITKDWGANKYTGYGYEDASSANTPVSALDSWKGSKPHNDVILNKDIWDDPRFSPWPAFGCAVNDSYSVLWFGDAVDPQTLP